ncbi:Helix-turn-helix [Desulfotomaculum arcticum]|uniref:Helix-turn-helix n=1 Tax=Desulfotruncus arcticus DSM 17038 TaxID=1121424 RepID=A0A1I2VIY0_9FIRM|nr:helix-turn-helix transcriptional regulator [Desulfotruncus arcticus]SFG88187.1 Helix-turn-helix [Desulfotomaculum arcticum] [Desulfotruncus arcticus DSM 17038]
MLKRLSELRKSKKWSLQYIADQLGIAKSTYAGYESGYREPSLEAMKKLANLFGTSVDYLVGRVDHPTTEEKTTLNDKFELAEFTSEKLKVDGQSLTDEEIKLFIAFIRAKREIET